MRPRGVLLVVILIAVATTMFGIGVAIEKSSLAPTTVATHPEGTGSETGEGAGTENSTPTSEAVLGIDPEAAPLVVAAILGSALLGLAAWLYWRRREILWAAAAGMAVFVVLDLVELVRQATERHTALAILASAVAILHAAAGAAAIRLATAGSRVAGRIAS